MMARSPDVPMLPATSDWVADTIRVPSVVQETASVHADPLQFTGPKVAPLIRIVTGGLSLEELPHAPPIEVTFAVVTYGNVRVVPLTRVTETTGAAVSMISALLPPSEFADASVGSVRLAALVAASVIVPPLTASEVVAW